METLANFLVQLLDCDYVIHVAPPPPLPCHRCSVPVPRSWCPFGAPAPTPVCALAGPFGWRVPPWPPLWSPGSATLCRCCRYTMTLCGCCRYTITLCRCCRYTMPCHSMLYHTIPCHTLPCGCLVPAPPPARCPGAPAVCVRRALWVPCAGWTAFGALPPLVCARAAFLVPCIAVKSLTSLALAQAN